MDKQILITGGAGFIGTNLAKRLLQQGEKVIILDNLSRSGSEQNLQYLQKKFTTNLEAVIEDIREKQVVSQLVAKCKMVFHFAAQVAVTTSIEDPIEDFQINCLGTLSLLEAARKQPNPPPILYTSTNKVYGNLGNLKLNKAPTRYIPYDEIINYNGIDEKQPLSFYSPYGCSKGTADQYMLDYFRIYNVPTVVFRLSCIYGPHQCGNEDQGWVAHFLLQALRNAPIIIYGDGKQVRDLLYVEDLIDAMILAYANMDSLAGKVFNIGGSVENSVSIIELIDFISKINLTKPEIIYKQWRKGDQLYYVSDIDKFCNATGWKPQMSYEQGVHKLYEWFIEFIY